MRPVARASACATRISSCQLPLTRKTTATNTESRNSMRRRLTFVSLMALLTAAPAAAQQRPLVTEDPETIGAGNVLFEGGFDLQREIFYPVSGLQGDLLRFPVLGLSFGLSSIAELQIDGGLYNRLKVTD